MDAAKPNSSKTSQRTAIVLVGVCLAAYTAFLFADLSKFPVVLWDESRLAVNALEMSQRGLNLVTTYGFSPDTWNTKPPLQIWLMSLALDIFPSAEFALRFPSAVAALGTVVIVGLFAYRQTESLLCSLIVSVLLIASKGFYGTHVARTADYDSLLVFFTTAYILLIFEFVHSERPGIWYGPLIGLLAAGAILTKSIAGMVPALGVLLYVLGSPRLRRAIVSPNILAGAVLAASIVLLYYGSREIASPGYLNDVWENEFERYVVPEDSDATLRTPLGFLRVIMLDFQFSLGPAIVPALVGSLFARGRVRSAIVYTALIGAVFIAVMSVSKTRYYWYAAPVYPLLAIACGLSIHSLLVAIVDGRLRLPHLASRMAVPAVLIGLSLIAARAVYDRQISLLSWRDAYESSYGQLLATLVREDRKDILVVDPGRGNFPAAAPDGHYNPILLFYALLIDKREGASINILTALPAAQIGPVFKNRVIATCNPAVSLAELKQRQIETIDKCSASTVNAGPPIH